MQIGMQAQQFSIFIFQLAIVFPLHVGSAPRTVLRSAQRRSAMRTLRHSNQLTQRLETSMKSTIRNKMSQSAERAPRMPRRGLHNPGLILPRFQLLVACRDEQDQRELYEKLTRAGRKCRVMVL